VYVLRVLLGAVALLVARVDLVGDVVALVDLVLVAGLEDTLVFPDLEVVALVLVEEGAVVVVRGDVALLEYALLEDAVAVTGVFAVTNLPVDPNPGGQ